MSKCPAHDAAYSGRLTLQDAAYGEPVATVAADVQELAALAARSGWRAVCFACGKEWRGPLYWHRCGGG